jgi:3-oxoacyl-[acyl-carrier-protein] synthase II
VRPALITGIGLLSGLGPQRGPVPERPPRDGFARRHFDGCDQPGWGCFVDDEDLAGLVAGRGLRSLGRDTLLVLAAGGLARSDAALEAGGPPDELGIFLGTALGGLDDYWQLYRSALARGFDRVSPMQGPQTGYNAPACQLAIRLHAEGPNLTLSSGAASATDALACAARWLDGRWSGAILAGGVDALSAPALGLLASAETGRPRPFDAARRGPVWGEAGAVCVLEPPERVRRRGARAHAAVVAAGEAAASPAGGDLAGACERALRGALREAGLPADRIGFAVASASGAVDGDAAEARALSELLGDRVPVCSLKGATGECLGAAGALQVAVAVGALHRGTLPATPGFLRADPELPPLAVTREAVRVATAHGLVLSLDPAGATASALVVSAP